MASLNGDDLEEYAVGLMSEYLTPQMQLKLRASRNLDAAKPAPQPAKPQGNKWAELAAEEAIEAQAAAKAADSQNKKARFDPRDMAK
eukprot:scaffold111507_cov45-Prasinocladus_malaysianus.AAC.1